LDLYNSGGVAMIPLYLVMPYLPSENSLAPTTVLIGFGITIYAILSVQNSNYHLEANHDYR
jgi:hypothetical protein